jgi:hypothetical protein
MTQHCFGPAGEDGGEPSSLVAELCVTQGVHGAVQPQPSTCVDPVGDVAAMEAQTDGLIPGEDSELAGRESRQLPIEMVWFE